MRWHEMGEHLYQTRSHLHGSGSHLHLRASDLYRLESRFDSRAGHLNSAQK
jgi:hypothetical protein